MEVQLPWIEILLNEVSKEFQKKTPGISKNTLDSQDKAYIQSILSEPIGFDADRLIKDSLNYTATKYSSGNHTVLVFSNQAMDLSLWFRVMRCLADSRPVRVVLFGSEVKRHLPLKGKPVEPIHINGGYTYKCSTTDIVIYRKEDSLRVLCHELLHGLCSDPSMDLPFLEANTEAWAEIVYVAFMAEGKMSVWKQKMKEQIQFAQEQAAYVQEHHKVNDASDYGWRYILGRLDVWEQLGLVLSKKHSPKKPDTLKLTKE